MHAYDKLLPFQHKKENKKTKNEKEESKKNKNMKIKKREIVPPESTITDVKLTLLPPLTNTKAFCGPWRC